MSCVSWPVNQILLLEFGFINMTMETQISMKIWFFSLHAVYLERLWAFNYEFPIQLQMCDIGVCSISECMINFINIQYVVVKAKQSMHLIIKINCYLGHGRAPCWRCSNAERSCKGKSFQLCNIIGPSKPWIY